MYDTERNYLYCKEMSWLIIYVVKFLSSLPQYMGININKIKRREGSLPCYTMPSFAIWVRCNNSVAGGEDKCIVEYGIKYIGLSHSVRQNALAVS